MTENHKESLHGPCGCYCRQISYPYVLGAAPSRKYILILVDLFSSVVTKMAHIYKLKSASQNVIRLRDLQALLSHNLCKLVRIVAFVL